MILFLLNLHYVSSGAKQQPRLTFPCQSDKSAGFPVADRHGDQTEVNTAEQSSVN